MIDRWRGAPCARLGACYAAMFVATVAAAQTPPDIARERADYLRWLTTAPNSPLFAVAQQPVGAGVALGPAGADIPLPGLGQHRLIARGGGFSLESPSGTRRVSRGRPVLLGGYTLFLTSAPTGMIVTVFGARSDKGPRGYYPYDPTLVFTGPLLPPETPGRVRILAPDGIEVDATEAGSVLIPLGGRTPLRVRRIPAPGGEESELEIFFRDQSNGQGTYPAGRFLSLIPLPGGAYRLDFNRARNPFCAYSSVYPCPAPWRGNAVAAPVHAGERYPDGGLKALPRDSVET